MAPQLFLYVFIDLFFRVITYARELRASLLSLATKCGLDGLIVCVRVVLTCGVFLQLKDERYVFVLVLPIILLKA